MVNVSIILTTYNHKEFIWEAINSIINQSFLNRKLFIWDDSPNEDTWNAISPFLHNTKIHAWHHKENKWIIENMNFLIDKVDKNDFVVFLEWDDVLVPDYIEKKLEIFEKFPEVNLVYNNLDFINKDSNIIKKDIFGYRHVKTYKNQKIDCDDFILAKVWPIISRSTIMLRWCVLEVYRPQSIVANDKKYAISDYDFAFNVSTENNVYYIEDSLTLYRRHASNLSAWNINLLKELSLLVELYFLQWKIKKRTFEYKVSQNSVLTALMELEKWNKKSAYQYFKHSKLKYNFVLKILTWFLLMLPKIITMKILSKLIKRK